jgi:hypothetical protein
LTKTAELNVMRSRHDDKNRVVIRTIECDSVRGELKEAQAILAMFNECDTNVIISRRRTGRHRKAALTQVALKNLESMKRRCDAAEADLVIRTAERDRMIEERDAARALVTRTAELDTAQGTIVTLQLDVKNAAVELGRITEEGNLLMARIQPITPPRSSPTSPEPFRTPTRINVYKPKKC